MHANFVANMKKHRRLAGVVGATALALAALSGAARAEKIQIVAIGASNTAGSGVGAAEAWPARLESILRSKGCDVSMTVQAGIGDTSARILSRVSSVPAGTKVVVYDIGAGNDQDAGAGDTGGNKAQIDQAIRARGAKPVFAAYARIVGSESSNKSAWVVGDKHHHLTAQSHARVAATLAPQVMAAIGKCK
jgi:acyl-CoA thioesterase-1